MYQCSELSTAKEIDAIFRSAAKHGAVTDARHPCVMLDEASLAPRALKAIHEHFDHPTVASVTLSNLQLDAAKTNRCLLVRRRGFGDDVEDLLHLARSSVGLQPY